MTHNSLITARYGTVVMENQARQVLESLTRATLILGGMAGDTYITHTVVACIIHSDRIFRYGR